MSKKYVCDICGRVIDDPYTAKMREYYLAIDCDDCGQIYQFPHKSLKSRVHLCNHCFEKLKEASKNEMSKL